MLMKTEDAETVKLARSLAKNYVDSKLNSDAAILATALLLIDAERKYYKDELLKATYHEDMGR